MCKDTHARANTHPQNEKLKNWGRATTAKRHFTAGSRVSPQHPWADCARGSVTCWDPEARGIHLRESSQLHGADADRCLLIHWHLDIWQFPSDCFMLQSYERLPRCVKVLSTVCDKSIRWRLDEQMNLTVLMAVCDKSGDFNSDEQINKRGSVTKVQVYFRWANESKNVWLPIRDKRTGLLFKETVLLSHKTKDNENK